MINKKIAEIKRFCKDFSKIENYEKAINSEELWECHHRLETHFSDGTSRGTPNNFLSVKELKALDMYYNRPPEEFIFLTKSEHISIHFKGLNRGERTKEHIEKIEEKRRVAIENGSYKNNYFHNPYSPKGKKWYTNGNEDKHFIEGEQPEGWILGRCKTKGRKQSEEEKQKRRESALKRTDYHKFSLTDEQKQKLSWAKKEYYGSLK